MSVLSALAPSTTPTSRVDEVVERISEAIHLGLLGDGEQLPIEPDLARQFGVAPMSDHELSRAIADYLKDSPSAESIGTLGRRIDPSSPV